MPLTFAPGEAYQFDWSPEAVLINGTRLYFPRLLAGTAGPGRQVTGLRGAVRDLAVLPNH